jgi:UDP-4-amino-4-deoxy-L-arabinose formyltransferase/UDP-glucuronic acid dehydrogenase (UDP-4-keto-hexauronic acid decarboxylating)
MHQPKPPAARSGPLQIVVFGYHDIGVACLQELLEQGAKVGAVVTHRDDPGETIWFGSVAELATAHGIPVYVPEDPNTPPFVEALRRLRPDLVFSFYYRCLLSPAILAIPSLGAINLHGSLLPKYRGRAPLNWVLVRGERRTGVTLHHMDARADHGDIIGQRVVPIAVEDTALTLSRMLTAAARALLAEMYPLILAGRAPRIPQNHAAATTFGRRTPADGLIDWSRSAWDAYNLIRAVTRPFPGAFTFSGGRKIFVWSARPPRGRSSCAEPGTILGVGDGRALDVATGDGILEVLRIQPEGGAETDGAGFLVTAAHGPTPRFDAPPLRAIVGRGRED